MNFIKKIFIVAGLLTSIVCSASQKDFDKLKESSQWNMQMFDNCTYDWNNQWTIDGLLAQINHTSDGMDFIAGPVNRDDNHHAVLWTKQSFEGDIKIEYDYTRTDSQIVNVNILYIQASGVDHGVYDKDISQWSCARTVSSMDKYYYGMEAIHISYAAFKMVNDDPEADYIRIRKYPAVVGEFKKTALEPDFFRTDLFQTGKTYAITVIKTTEKLYFEVKGEDQHELYEWDLAEKDRVEEGRIGLRHMYTRSSQYKDFKVSTK